MNNLNPEAKLYFYKLVADSGGAPCVTQELLSLAICKPMIRSTARAGDVIFGFAANALHKDNRLIYIAVIKDNLGTGRYFREHVYMNRDDCIYRWQDRGFVIRSDARFHENGANLEHDLGAPPDYARANVLLSEDFRYFGGSGPVSYKDKQEFSEIKAAVEALGRGHRVNEPEGLRKQLAALKDFVWRTYPDTKVLGKPSQPVDTSISRRCGASCVVGSKEVHHHPDD